MKNGNIDNIFIYWIYFVSIILISIYILESFNFISGLFREDISYISSIIVFIFTFYLFRGGYHLYKLRYAIDSFKVNETTVNENLFRNPIIATKLNQVIGYDLASKVVKEAYRTNSSIFDIAEKMTTLTKTELIKILDPKKLI